MIFKKKVILIALGIIMVLSFSNLFGQSSGLKGIRYKGAAVEEIYAKIRNTALKYEKEESIVTFKNEGMNLEGTLTVPKAKGICPIVITLGGFVGNRDEEPIPGAGETVYQRLCRVLAGFGIASLRLDFRGYGNSDGTFSMISFSTQISDVMAAIDYIRKDLKGKVYTEAIGILGFSNGGLIASMTAARDKRVDTVVLWSPPAFPPICYENLLTKAGIKQGLALKEGETVTLGLYADEQYLYWDVTMGMAFFQDLFLYDPLGEIRNYKRPMMVISGLKDNIVWPQPHQSEIFLKYHDGFEKLVEIDADHEFDYWDGPAAVKLTDAIYWSTAWFIRTLIL